MSQHAAPWKTPDMVMLRAWFGFQPAKVLAKNLRRSVEDVEAQAVKLGLMKPVLKVAGLHKPEHDERAGQPIRIQARPVRTSAGVRPMRTPTGVMVPRHSNKPRAARPDGWVEDQVRQLEALFPTHSTSEVAAAIGRNVGSVKMKAKALGLRKAMDYRQDRSSRAYGSGRLSLIRALRDACEHLRKGDHLAALNCLDSALNAVDAKA
jgi:hypothetical protein